MSETATIRNLACRTILALVSERTDPLIVQRTRDFMADRGAIGLLLVEHDGGKPWEAVCLNYWNSRQERTAARLEDLVTSILIAVVSGVVAGVVTEFIKARSPLLKNKSLELTAEQLGLIIQSAQNARPKLAAIYTLMSNKEQGSSQSQDFQASRLYKQISDGRTLEECAAEVAPASLPRQLEHLDAVAKGVVETALSPPAVSAEFRYERRLAGLPFSPGLAFGEVISLIPRDKEDFDVIDAHEALAKAGVELKQRRLHPKLWPKEIGSTHDISPKIIVASNKVQALLRNACDALLTDAAGIISVGDGGMTSHIAIISRVMGTPAIGSVDLKPDEIARATFAWFCDGDGSLYFSKPGITAKDFEAMLRAAKKPTIM
ncbi:MAG: hypothetical protein HY054_11320 [Proteobacteria bacterium]|nr:hypothetical protein [Pseudomonadota bacterium]